MSYHEKINLLLGTEVKVYVDRKIHTKHPKHQDLIYLTNYGYIKEIIAPDSEYQDAYILGVDEPLDEFYGIVIAIVHRLNDNEDKLVVVPKGLKLEKEEIIKKINYQEKYFEIEIIMN